MAQKSQCDTCVHFDYNEFADCYECNVNMDEDDVVRYSCRAHDDCPFYRYHDEYLTVRKQM
ncbi:MAG: DUF6472 family protein [Firmicutes bacterium]|nr:DUF6472 family protein [Bacillota bacterium]